MPPIDLNPKYHSMPERPNSYTCPQCGQTVADIESGKCQNCGHLFDIRQFRKHYEKPIDFQYKASSRKRTEKKAAETDKSSPIAPETKIESICPRCKTNVNSLDVMNSKCPLCGYIGPMTSRQTDELKQTSPTSQSAAHSLGLEQLDIGPSEEAHISPVSDISSAGDSSTLKDAASKDWKNAELFSVPDKKATKAKESDISREWREESTNGFSFANLLQNIRNVNDRIPLIGVFRIAGTLALTALIVFGIIKIIPLVMPSSSSDSESQQTQPSIANEAPEILTVEIANNSITHSSVTITWTTSKQATSKLEYGENNNYGMVESSDKLTENHSITLSDLEPDTNYYYRITCIDADGRTVNYEAEQPFITATLPDTTPPTITKVIVNPSKITDVSAVISWELDDREADSHIEFGDKEQYDNRILSKKDSTNVRTAVLGGLEPSTTYYFRIIAEDNIGNKAEPYTGEPFTTLAPIPTGTDEGDRAPDFNLEYFIEENLPQEYIINGDNVNLSDFRGKVVIVNFWSISCGGCVKEMPDIQEVYEKSDKDELIILAIHTKQYPSRITRYFEEAEWFLPVLLDTDGDVSRKYKITRIPKTFFIDAKGIIQKVKLGRFNSPDEIESILEKESLLGSKL